MLIVQTKTLSGVVERETIWNLDILKSNCFMSQLLLHFTYFYNIKVIKTIWMFYGKHADEEDNSVRQPKHK
jgi:hypothetical protein